jgi:hypothetical protein
MKLQIPFVTQQQNRHRNDCGAACVAMLCGVTIERVLAVAKQPQDAPMHLSGIMTALAAYRAPREYVEAVTLPAVRRWLANGNPVIALVGYGRLPAAQRAIDYHRNHYVVIVGYLPDGSFLIHDPLWPDERGAYRVWSEAELGDAWGNPVYAKPWQGIAIRRPYTILEATASDVLPLVVEVAEQRAGVYLDKLLNAMDIAPGRLEERVGHALARIVVWRAAAGK